MTMRTRVPQQDGQTTAASTAAGSTAVGHKRLIDRVAAELAARLAIPPAPGLYLVATPIGHLADITLRALCVLSAAGEVYCEDTRESQKLLGRYGLDRRLSSYHEHNAERERPRILAQLEAGAVVAIVSDAGTPLISDPGYKLVRAAIEAGHPVCALPGPSATLTALAVSGLPTDSFHFCGFLPPKSVARQGRIAALGQVPGTLILFEAPSRLAATLADLAHGLGPRPAAVARELTKLHEEVRRGSLSELAAWASATPAKGEIVVVIGPAAQREVTDVEIEAAIDQHLATASVRDAAAMVAVGLGVPRSRVYDLAIARKRRTFDVESPETTPETETHGETS